jgi:enoyl-CoA hydratase/carnithine racemase
MAFVSDVLAIEKQGAVGILWLDRPEKYNAMSTELWSSFPAALDELLEDKEIGAIVLAGRGKHFCVGIDLVQDSLSDLSHDLRRRIIFCSWKIRGSFRLLLPLLLTAQYRLLV